MVYESFSEQDTKRIAAELAKNAVSGKIYALTGDLGAGKTVFAKGFAIGLGICETITSPTFTIFKEYHSGRLPMYHMDAYRLIDKAGLYDTGFEDYFYGDGVCLIEWADMLGELVDESNNRVVRIKIDRAHGDKEDYRKIIIDETT